MDGIKVREVSGDEEKSSQQIEQELLDKHDADFNESNDDGVAKVVIPDNTPGMIEILILLMTYLSKGKVMMIFQKMCRLFLSSSKILVEVLRILLN